MIFDNTPKWYGYFSERLKNKIHQAVLAKFLEQEKAGMVNAEIIANRLGKTPEEIKNMLGAPGDWTLDTISDLLYAMGCELDLEVTSIEVLVSHNE